MTTAHSTLTGADLHENKGVASAADNTIATAASGATVWQKVTNNSIDSTSIFNINYRFMTTHFVDVSTPEKVYLVVPFNATLTKVDTTLQGAITTANSTLTVRNNAGSSAGTITVAFAGSAAGDIDTLSPSSNNTFTTGQKMSIETDGASSTAARLDIVLTFLLTS